MRDRLALQQSRCSSGRDNLNTHLAKTASKRNQTSLIGKGNESAIDLHGGQKIIKGTVSVENRSAPTCPLRRHAETPIPPQSSRSVLDRSQPETCSISARSWSDSFKAGEPMESPSWSRLLAPMIGAVTNG